MLQSLITVLKLSAKHASYAVTLKWADMVAEFLEVHPVIAGMLAKDAAEAYVTERAKYADTASVKLGKEGKSGFSPKEALKFKGLQASPALRIVRAAEFIRDDFSGNGLRRDVGADLLKPLQDVVDAMQADAKVIALIAEFDKLETESEPS